MPLSDALSRRRVLGGAAASLALAGCRGDAALGRDISGLMPDLAFTMTRAGDGAEVTQTAYRGQVSVMFFGFTFCPDICPMTLANLSAVTRNLGDEARDLSILFVTVDPGRDSLDVLERYVGAFTDRADGLRGTPNQIARLTRRMRVTYRIADHPDGAERYDVAHGKSVYLFDRAGGARRLWPDFETTTADIPAGTDAIRRLIREGGTPART